MGGSGAVWVRAGQKPGTVRLKATHSALGTREVEIKIAAVAAERV
jgi:beta-galactosidase